jgi:hypothetical protein
LLLYLNLIILFLWTYVLIILSGWLKLITYIKGLILLITLNGLIILIGDIYLFAWNIYTLIDGLINPSIYNISLTVTYVVCLITLIIYIIL